MVFLLFHQNISANLARLINSENDFSGTVELLYQGVWRKVCDDHWGLNEAIVVCRQLGWPGAMSAKSSLQHGISADGTILEQVSCVGDEMDISDCYNHSRLTSECSTGRAAAVICDRRKCSHMCTNSFANSSKLSSL